MKNMSLCVGKEQKYSIILIFAVDCDGKCDDKEVDFIIKFKVFRV